MTHNLWAINPYSGANVLTYFEDQVKQFKGHTVLIQFLGSRVKFLSVYSISLRDIFFYIGERLSGATRILSRF